ncbi:hypothetical protein V501_00728 [Pseudogymnoascus sp. VKM F-4519 (FW-2642)]|nr:hypothetical protein V501_00728 [Pseudogymnoascus sp. VKM F-4519 (FW-2642)]
MSILSQRLASEERFADLDIEPSTRAKLNQAGRAFHKRELTKSANLFLDCYRILHSEFERNLYTLQDSLLDQEPNEIRKNKERKLLSLISLHDLAQACSRNYEEYKDEDGKCKLEIHAPRSGWSGLSIADNILIEEDDKVTNWQQGKSIANLLPLCDPLGRVLKEAASFQEAAIAVSKICSFQVACISDPYKHEDGYKFMIDSMSWTRLRISGQEASVKAAKLNASKFTQIQEPRNDDREEDENTRKLLVPNLEPETEGSPLGKEEEEEISNLINQFSITPYSGMNFKQMQNQEESNSSDEEKEPRNNDLEEDENTRKLLVPNLEPETEGSPLGKEEEEEISNLINQFSITPYSGMNFKQMQKQEESNSSDKEN